MTKSHNTAKLQRFPLDKLGQSDYLWAKQKNDFCLILTVDLVRKQGKSGRFQTGKTIQKVQGLIMEFKIEKNIPIPDEKKSRGTGYIGTLKRMEVGDSFRFDIKLRNRVSGAASYFKFRHGREFIIRKINDKECRCWRIK